MRRAKRWLLMIVALLVLITHATAVAPFKKVSIATSTKSTAATSSVSTTTEASTAEADEEKPSNVSSSTPTKNSKLTGIPQIDYIWDPNLPRELRGYNLSSYPFFSTVPPEEDIHFKCDGLHDGFYAAIEFKCQVYHHCVYGIRHDFLCANFTAFDQKTFICHFVSDVDCEGSQKYWNRNDNLYMATTTTSTTTTTTEPPPTQRRRTVRPLRPLRRPINRRPIDDYYYEDEQEYDDEYYDELVSRRRKQRPRHRKPIIDDYADEYDEKRSFNDDNKRRRPNLRDRFRDEEESEDEYESDGRKNDAPKSKPNKPERTGGERRSTSSRKPGSIPSRTDERRSFSDDKPVLVRKDSKPKQQLDSPPEPSDIISRRLAGRRRNNEKRTSPTPAAAVDFEDFDDDEKPKQHALDQEEAAEEDAPPKIKTTPKPLEEFVTPKAAPASLYARPRAPPRIARPVPIAEKKKYQYPVQKSGTTSSSSVAAQPDDDSYYDDEEYDDRRIHRGHSRRRIVEEIEDDLPAVRRRNRNEAALARKPGRSSLRKPIGTTADQDYDSSAGSSHEHFDSRSSIRKRPYSSRPRTSVRDLDDMDFVDDDYDERALKPAITSRSKAVSRKVPKKAQPVVEEDEDELEDEVAFDSPPEQAVRSHIGANQRRRKPLPARQRQTAPAVSASVEASLEKESEAEDETESEVLAVPHKSAPTAAPGRTASVRVVKRPFLPSRGGSPYLPRGLQPVGVALKHLGNRAYTTDSTPIDMGSTISGVRLLEHGAPILRGSGYERTHLPATHGPRTTLPPRSAIPISQTRKEPPNPPQRSKITLDELYETDYDVTLNDALNPTLKPLAPHTNNHKTRNYIAGAGAGTYSSEPAAVAAANPFVNNNQSPAIYHNNNNNYQLTSQQQQLHLPQQQPQTQHEQQQQQQQQHHQQHHPNAYQSVPHSSLSQSPQSQPLSQPLSQTQTHHQQHPQSQQTPPGTDNYNSDSYFSSTDIRRRAILAASPPRSSQTDYRGLGTRIAQHFYDDFEY